MEKIKKCAKKYVRSAKCFAPQNIEKPATIDLVTGENGEDLRYVWFCRNARDIDRFCGPEGKWFEER